MILKPKGRGNWRSLRMEVTGAHLPFLTVKAGDLVPLGGVVFRIVKVLP
ncbi:MAG TPA: hypothetical protein VFM98_01735 [Ramlibacter sp.]|nr:hypothetical protein [Ramlibacter sp.]HET8744296.1 hypothetical protein [Ramlibacter sp.]